MKCAMQPPIAAIRCRLDTGVLDTGVFSPVCDPRPLNLSCMSCPAWPVRALDSFGTFALDLSPMCSLTCILRGLQVLVSAANAIATAYHDLHSRARPAPQQPSLQHQLLDEQEQEEARLVARARALLHQLDAKAKADPHLMTPGTGLHGRGAEGASTGSRALWAQLQSTAWCPVLKEPPEEGACTCALVYMCALSSVPAGCCPRLLA